MRTNNAIRALVLGVVVSSCSNDPKHPAAADVVAKVDGPSAGTVDGVPISLSEVAEFARTRDAATTDDLVKRERAARSALANGADVRLARKQAMVRALLHDEIEAKVPISTVSKETLDKEKLQVESEIKDFGGYEVVSVRVAAIDLVRKKKGLEPERIAELADMVADTAQKLYEAVPEHDAIEAALNLDRSWVDPAIHVEVFPNLKLVDPAETRDPPKGWVKAYALAGDVKNLADGDRSVLRVINGVPVFTVRRQRIEPEPIDNEEVASLAEARVLAVARREKLNGLLEELKKSTTIRMQPQLLQESQ